MLMNNSRAYSTEYICANAKRFRKQCGMTLKELAETTGFSTAKLSRMENGHVVPKKSTLERLAQLYGCTIDDFYAAPVREKSDLTYMDEPRVRQLVSYTKHLNQHGWRTLITVAQSLAENGRCLDFEWSDIDEGI